MDGRAEILADIIQREGSHAPSYLSCRGMTHGKRAQSHTNASCKPMAITNQLGRLTATTHRGCCNMSVVDHMARLGQPDGAAPASKLAQVREQLAGLRSGFRARGTLAQRGQGANPEAHPCRARSQYAVRGSNHGAGRVSASRLRARVCLSSGG